MVGHDLIRRFRADRIRPVYGGKVITPRRARASFCSALAVLALSAAACGGTTSSGMVFIRSGQAPPGAIPTGGEGRLASSVASTVPLAQQNPTTALFTAVGVFQSCLTNLGVKFVGAPNPSNPSSPANNPSYIKNLITCATKSDIVQALKAAQSAQDNLTPSQVKQENRDYLKWRKCMISRGWGIPQPTPNAKGLLFSFGGTGGGSGGGAGGGFKAPPGQSLLSSSDLQQCAAIAQQGGS